MEIRFRASSSWIAFLLFALPGMGLMMHPEPRMQWIGASLILIPLLVLSGLLALFYWKTGRVETAVQSGVRPEHTKSKRK